ncbi:hypothetical protein ACJ73_06788 [Blastomyces percursus]|uniref:Chromo domain-containing protein n=1 Tax=Blastomyces percursus TaxID=1658174 RepID=A0A1J9R063_9EURO|nr:hypothetical protein ACJ73_06788 [Blastomyces percursus]
MHPVVSVIHLEKTELAPEDMEHPPSEPVFVDGKPEFEIERIIRKEVREGKTYLEVKCRGYDDPTLEPYDVIADDVPILIKAFEQRKPRGRPRKNAL